MVPGGASQEGSRGGGVRFNSPEHLAAWQERGQFPVIHDAMARAAANLMRGDGILDLGCSYGLLGARIAHENVARAVVGVELDPQVIQAASTAGVPVQFVTM